MPADFERYLTEEMLRSGETDREKAAVRAVFRRYRKRMEQSLRRQLPRAEAFRDDVLMDAMVEVYKKRSILLTHPAPIKWVFSVLFNVAKNKLHKEKKHLLPHYDEEAESVKSDLRSDGDVRISDLVMAIRKAMERLSPREYEVFDRSYFGCLEPEQISNELGIALQTVQNLRSISRKKVQEELKKLKLDE